MTHLAAINSNENTIETVEGHFVPKPTSETALSTSEATEEACCFHSDDEIVMDWLMSKSKHTQRSYLGTLRQFQDLIDKPLRRVNKKDIQFFVAYCNRKGNKPVTINKKLSAIKSLFNHCLVENYRSHNPAKNVTSVLPDKEKKESQTKDVKQRVISPENIKKIVASANCQRDRVMFELLYRTGMRMHECLNLSWDDFYYDGQCWRVHIVGKGSKQRDNKIPDDLYQKLTELNTDNYLFLSNRRKPLSPRMADKALKQAVRRAGLSSEISCHDFRHSHASHALANGASLIAVRDQLGHSSIRVTSQYLHSNESSSDFISF